MTDATQTRLALLVDRSGSMASIAKDMNGGIQQLLADQAKEPGTVVVDITTFDDKIEYPFEGVRPDDIKVDVLVPRGMTALNDAVGRTIVKLGETLAAMDEDDRPGKVVFVIVTDGAENASREYRREQVKEMVLEQQQKWGWEFMFLAANIDAQLTGSQYGFNAAQTLQYGATSKGARSAFATASSGLSRTRSGLAADFTDEEREDADA